MALSSNTTISLELLPNPYTPMAFLPPDVAFQATMGAYITAGVSSVLIWDILDNLKVDFGMIWKFAFTHLTAVYMLSRLSSLAFVIAAFIFQIAPVKNCAALDNGIAWIYTVAITSTSLLFFFRVRAVFDRNTYVTSFFAFLWIGILVGCVVATQGVKGAQIANTGHCFIAGLNASQITALAIIPVVNDTLVFFAISWRLMKNTASRGCDFRTGLRTMFLGDYMPRFSKSILQDGQMYYLATVSTSLLILILLYIPEVSEVYESVLSVPNIVLMNIMACRVFRKTKLGLIDESGSLPPMVFRIPLSLPSDQAGTRSVVDDGSVVRVDITKTVEHTRDSDGLQNHGDR